MSEINHDESKVSNKIYKEIAVALQYIFGKQGEVPKVVAVGRGYIAKRIIELARKYNIPIKENKILAESLIKLNVGDEIPPQLWEAVAEILAQIFLLDANLAYKINQQDHQNKSE